MNCFDCRDLSPAETTAAVGVCRGCGAGICYRHAHSGPHLLHRLAGTGLASRPRAARRLLCGTCAQAERSG
ncbi:DUF2180 family protein [Streptomyces seoulensis]|nr:DUF2180 family protein [Streptomyces seoulensis]